MTIKIDFKYGDPAFIKNDPEQCEMTFVGFIGRPGNLQYILDYVGEEFIVFDFQVTSKPDMTKKLNLPKKDVEDEE